MSTRPTTRRAMLAGAAKRRPSSRQPKTPLRDPIFAALIEDRRCDRKWCMAQRKLSDAEDEKKTGGDWRKRTGFAKLKVEYERATVAWRRSRRALAEVRPTTTAGATALVEHVRRDLRVGHAPWHHKALAHAVEALCAAAA